MQRFPAKVLVADDDATTLQMLTSLLEEAGYQVEQAEDGLEVIRKISASVDLVFLDLDMPRASGFECMDHLQREYPETPIVIVSGAGIDQAVKAMKYGAYWFLTKPIKKEELLNCAKEAINHTDQTASQARAIPIDIDNIEKLFVGESRAIRNIVAQIRSLSAGPDHLLICGGEGNGKSFLAKLIHQSGERCGKPLIALSCSSLNEDTLDTELFGNQETHKIGRFQQASGGALYLNEIGRLPRQLQQKLLIALNAQNSEQSKSHVRLYASTSEDLPALVKRKIFDRELYTKLSKVTIDIPPLRARTEDIRPLTSDILQKISARRGLARLQISVEALDTLIRYDWPGNVRELQNVLERAVTFCNSNTIALADLMIRDKDMVERDVQPWLVGGLPLEEIERRAVIETLKLCNGNRTEAAKILKVSERTIYNKIKQYGLEDKI